MDYWSEKIHRQAIKLDAAFIEYERQRGDGEVGEPSQFNRLRHRTVTLLSQAGIPGHYLKGYLQTEEYAGKNYVPGARGVLRALIEDLQDDLLPPVGWQVRSDAYTELLDLAETLYNDGHLLPAAVVTGAVLEGHLRTLCDVRGLKVAVGKTGGSLGKYADALHKSKHLSKDLFRAISSWITLRNEAAHMKAEALSAPAVMSMLAGVRTLLVQCPAV